MGMLALIAEHGYRAVVIDLPGFAQSEASELPPLKFLLSLLESLSLDKPILVSPSMSGIYSLPLVATYPDKLAGFVLVAPVGIDIFEDQLRGKPLPTLAI